MIQDVVLTRVGQERTRPETTAGAHSDLMDITHLSTNEQAAWHGAIGELDDLDGAVDLFHECLRACLEPLPNELALLLGDDLGSGLLLGLLAEAGLQPTCYHFGIDEGDFTNARQLADQFACPLICHTLSDQALRERIVSSIHRLGRSAGLGSIFLDLQLAGMSERAEPTLVVESILGVFGQGIDRALLNAADPFAQFWTVIGPAVNRAFFDHDEINVITRRSDGERRVVSPFRQTRIVTAARQIHPRVWLADGLDLAPLRYLARQLGLGETLTLHAQPTPTDGLLKGAHRLLMRDAQILVADQVGAEIVDHDPLLAERLWLRLLGELGI